MSIYIDLFLHIATDFNTLPFLIRFLFIAIMTFGIVISFYYIIIQGLPRVSTLSFIGFILFMLFVLLPTTLKFCKENPLINKEMQKLRENIALGIGLFIIGVALAVYRDWI
jgi:hypothetical protein